MAALALIFAIQDYDPSPSITLMRLTKTSTHTTPNALQKCAVNGASELNSSWSPKVSLKLADHHIGITHGGDGCSRRILDFDRERAIALGEAALKEAQKDADKNESRIMDAVAAAEDMPEVPEPMAVPRSLGGLLPHMQANAPEPSSEAEGSLGGLLERTTEMTEDINERADVAARVADVEENDQGLGEVETVAESEEQ